MFKSVIVYRLAPGWAPPSIAALEEGLERGRFAPCGPTDARSAGWIEPRGREHASLLESVGGHLILSLRSETRAVPASVVKSALEERLRRIEDETGARPRGKRRKELKEEVVIDLLPRAFSKYSATRLWLDPQAGTLVAGAGSATRADEAVAALRETLRGIGNELTVHPVKTALAPSVAMSHWLSSREAPEGFTIDRECELKQGAAAPGAAVSEAAVSEAAASPGGSSPAGARPEPNAAVRYARHNLDIDEIVAHIAQGKVASRLAMTWRDRVSFVLDAQMILKKIEILDVALEDAGKGRGSRDAEDGFDADIAIATGELGGLIQELFEALGGEQETAPDASKPATGASAAGEEAQAAAVAVCADDPASNLPGTLAAESAGAVAEPGRRSALQAA